MLGELFILYRLFSFDLLFQFQDAAQIEHKLFHFIVVRSVKSEQPVGQFYFKHVRAIIVGPPV